MKNVKYLKELYRFLYENSKVIKSFESKRFQKMTLNSDYELYRNEILLYYENSLDPEINIILKYLKAKKNPVKVFNYDYANNFNPNIKAYWDKKAKMYFVLHNQKKMYLKKGMLTGATAEYYYRSLLLEQHPLSPHRYNSDKFDMKNINCLLDIGGAEGIFALDYLDTAKHIYIFECDEGWLEALKYTFEPYKNKVTIIPKFVSDKDGEGFISIDNFQNSIETEIDFLKMDIEGNEINALKGAKKVFHNRNLRIIACTYHNSSDEKKIRKLLKDFNVEVSDGYMLFGDKLTAPFLRKGVIRAY